MGLVQLPSELIFLIAEWLDTQDCILSLALVNKRLSELVTHHLLKFNIRHRQSSALLWAANVGCKKTTRKLLKLKADVNTSTPSGLMPLHFAAQAGHITIARLLIKHGATVDPKDKLGMTPLDYASGLSIFLLLVDQEADPVLDPWVVRELRGEHPDKRVQRMYLRNGGPAWSLRGFDYASISIGRTCVGKPYLDANPGSKRQEARQVLI